MSSCCSCYQQVSSSIVSSSGGMSYSAAEAYLMSSDISKHRAGVLQSLPPDPSWLSRLFCCGSAAVLPERGRLCEERVKVLALARLALDNDDSHHVELLEAVYHVYTGAGISAGMYQQGYHLSNHI